MRTHSKRLETTLSEDGLNMLKNLEKTFSYYLGLKRPLGLGRTIELLMCVRLVDVEIFQNLNRTNEINSKKMAK